MVPSAFMAPPAARLPCFTLRLRQLLVPLCLLILACGTPETPPSESGLLFELIPEGVQRVDFAGHGDIKLGEGWQTRRRASLWTPWRKETWAGRTPSLYFSASEPRPYELVLHLEPFTIKEKRPQVLTPSLNGESIESLTLGSGWQEVRIPFPEELVSPGLNRVQLRFSRARRPSREESGRKLPRRSAAFDRVELRPLEERPLAHWDPERRLLTLPAGASWRVPLPLAGASLRLGSASGGGPADYLKIGVANHRTLRRLWAGGALEAKGLELRLPLNGSPSELVFEHLPRAQAGGPSSEPLELELPEGWLTPLVAQSPWNPARPPIFIFTLDTLRADALEIYGSERPTSPRLTELARDSVIFDNAWSTSSWTLPSTVSLLTGVYPERHGFNAMRFKQQALEERPPLLAEMLWRDRGYDSVAISQSFLVSKDVFGGGFRRFYVADALSRGTNESGDVPFFFWQFLRSWPHPTRPLLTYVHTQDPHAPYTPEGEDRRFVGALEGRFNKWHFHPLVVAEGGSEADARTMRGLYDGDVLHADRELGVFLDFLRYLGLYEESVIIVTSDHGEEFGEHGGFGHARTLYEELLHVPLIAKLPGQAMAGTRVSARVSGVDVVPTVLDLAGADKSAYELDGVSFADPRRLDHQREVLASVTLSASRQHQAVDLKALVSGPLKCIYSTLGEDRFGEPIDSLRVFDLLVDPAERSPLDKPRARNLCAERGRKRFGELRELSSTPPSEPVSEEERARLEALGYL